MEMEMASITAAGLTPWVILWRPIGAEARPTVAQIGAGIAKQRCRANPYNKQETNPPAPVYTSVPSTLNLWVPAWVTQPFQAVPHRLESLCHPQKQN